MKAHHLQLNLPKTELLVFPAKPTIHHSICIQTESLSLAPSKVARNLGVVIDDQLTFKDPIASVARSKHKKDQAILNPTRHPAPGAVYGHRPP